MQAQKVETHEAGSPDHLRIKELVNAAGDKVGGFRQLADLLRVHPQLVSNWRNGVKTPSPEAQADLAQIAGQNVLVTGLMALIEKSTGDRRERLQFAYKQWMRNTSASHVAKLYFFVAHRPRFSAL